MIDRICGRRRETGEKRLNGTGREWRSWALGRIQGGLTQNSSDLIMSAAFPRRSPDDYVRMQNCEPYWVWWAGIFHPSIQKPEARPAGLIVSE